MRPRATQHDTREQRPVQLQSAPSPGGDFSWGARSARAKSVLACISSGSPVVLRLSGIPDVSLFDKELRASSATWRGCGSLIGQC